MRHPVPAAFVGGLAVAALAPSAQQGSAEHPPPAQQLGSLDGQHVPSLHGSLQSPAQPDESAAHVPSEQQVDASGGQHVPSPQLAAHWPPQSGSSEQVSSGQHVGFAFEQHCAPPQARGGSWAQSGFSSSTRFQGPLMSEST